MRRALAFLASCIVIATGSRNAWAYRPFDGTDADVAELGDFELELGPVHWYSQAGAHYLLMPATVLNLGILPRWELVVDFQNAYGLDPPAGQARDRLLDTDVLLKTVLLEGSQQDKGPAPSVAAEFGPLLPEMSEQNAFGASLDVIVTHHTQNFTVHLNNWLELSRGDLNVNWFEGFILEGNQDATVRPVSEWFVEHDFVSGVTTVSGLVGGIWKAEDGLDLDLGLREASVGCDRATEVRLGLTWTLGVWTPGTSSRKAHGGHRWLALSQ